MFSLCCSLAGRLQALPNSNFYHSEQESFIRFEKIGTDPSNPDSWTATDRNGIVYYFGETSESRIITDSSNGNKTQTWGLSKVQDQNGNNYTITYANDNTSGDATLYPKEIEYNETKIIFSYETRADSIDQYVSGTARRLSKVSRENYDDITFVYKNHLVNAATVTNTNNDPVGDLLYSYYRTDRTMCNLGELACACAGLQRRH